MDIEDKHLLFDIEQVSRRLDLLVAKHLQVLSDTYTGVGSNDPNADALQMTLIALKASVAELIVQNNRVLWHNIQRLSSREIDENDLS